MVSLFEWQRKQKSLKDAERNRLKRASSFNHKYRGGVHVIKHQKQQKILKEAERERRRRASIAKHTFRGGDHVIKLQKNQKIAKDAERDGRENASKMLRNYQGGEHDIKAYERDIIQERKMKNDARATTDRRLRSLFSQHDQRMDLSSTSQIVSVAAIAAALDEKERGNCAQDSIVPTMTTFTEIPMGSDNEYSPSSSRRNSISLKSIVSFSSMHYFDEIDLESHADDSRADFDTNIIINNTDGDNVRNIETKLLEEGLRESSSSSIPIHEGGINNFFGAISNCKEGKTTAETVTSNSEDKVVIDEKFREGLSPFVATNERGMNDSTGVISSRYNHENDSGDSDLFVEEGFSKKTSPLVSIIGNSKGGSVGVISNCYDDENEAGDSDFVEEGFDDSLSLVPINEGDTDNSVELMLTRIDEKDDCGDSNFIKEGLREEMSSSSLTPIHEGGIGDSVRAILKVSDDKKYCGERNHDSAASLKNYYDWTTVPSNAENDDSYCSGSLNPICLNDTMSQGSIHSDFSASKSSILHNIPMTISEDDYYDWSAVKSNTSLHWEAYYSHNLTKSDGDNCTASLSDKESSTVSDGSDENIKEDVFGDISFNQSYHARRSRVSDSKGDCGSMNLVRKISSETGSSGSQPSRQRFLSLRGIMFNSSALGCFPTIDGEAFFDAKEDFSDNYSKDAPELNEWKKTVRFVESKDNVLEWRNTPHLYSKILDVYNESTDGAYSDSMNPNDINSSRADFYRTLYIDEMEMINCGYDSEDDSDPDERVVRSFLYNVGFTALTVLVQGITKIVSAVQNDRRASTVFLVEEAIDITHAAELVADSAAASAAASSTSASATSASAAVSVAAVGQGTAIAAQNVMMQSMAISAVGSATSSVAGASSAVAAVAGATTVTATATVSTATTVAATTAAFGVVAISAGAAISNNLPPECRTNPVNTVASVKISFPVLSDNSLTLDVVEGIMGWEELGNQIVETYNNVSTHCDETHQRTLSDCFYKDHEFYSFDGETMMIDTYWEPVLTCNDLCPTLDPLFGIDALNPVTSLLQGFHPILKQKEMLSQATLIDTEAPNEAPTSTPSKVPINRTEFLLRLGAKAIDPLPQNISSGELPNVSFQVEVLTRGDLFIPTMEQISIEATMFILEQDVPSRRLEPYYDPRGKDDIPELKIAANANMNSPKIRANETNVASVLIDMSVEFDPLSKTYSESVIVSTDPEILSRQFEDIFLQRGFDVSVAILNVESNSLSIRGADSLNSIDSPSPVPDDSVSRPVVSGPPVGERQLVGSNLFDSEDQWESVIREHRYGEDFEVLEYLNVVSRMKKGHSILSDILRGPFANEPSTSPDENEGINRAIVAYSAPTSLDYSEGKNAMYFTNFHYFLDHAIDCKKHSTVILTTSIVANEYRSRIEAMNDKLCRYSQFTIELLEREDKCYDMESMATFIRETDSSKYDYFLYVNCGVVGPKTKGGRHWTEIFISRLSQTVKLTGVSINMSFHPHVQSFVLATDTTGIEIIKNSNSIYDCGVKNGQSMTDEEKWKIIEKYEIGMSRAIINAGYSINSLTGSFGESISVNNDGIQEIIRRSNDHASFAPLISASESNVWDSNSASLVLPLGDDIWNSNAIRTIGKGRLPAWSDFIFFKASRGILLPEILTEVGYDDHSISLVKDLSDSLPNYEDSTKDICAEATKDFREASKLSVIVTGFEHSGTTMLAQLIKSSPGLFGGFECGILNRVKSPIFYDWLLWPMQDDLWGLNSESRDLVINAKCPAEAYHRLQRYSPLFHFTPNQNSTIVDKNPGYLVELVKVMDQTPGIPVVIAQKSLSSQIASYKQRGMTDDEINSKISGLSNTIDEAMKKYPGRIYIANTTRWHEYPNEVMGGVFDFLGLEWRSEYLSMNALNSKRVPGSVFSKPFDTSRVEK